MDFGATQLRPEMITKGAFPTSENAMDVGDVMGHVAFENLRCIAFIQRRDMQVNFFKNY